MLTERVSAFLEREQLLSPGQKVVAGVSGGADSLCLLDCLCRLGFAVLVAHFDHRLRPGSWRDAQYVLRVARRLGVPAVAERAAPGSLAPGAGVEEAARMARYRFLVREAKRWGASSIATGHTADDQAETILMHFLRGSGVHGLRGMLPRTDLGQWAALDHATGVCLVRPLLVVSRDETVEYCAGRGYRPRQDPTNRDPAFVRNRIRARLMPALAKYNPRVREVLARTGEVMRREAEMVDGLVEVAAPKVFADRLANAIRIRRAVLRAQPQPIQAGLLGRAVRALAPETRDIGFEALERVRQWMDLERRGSRLPLPNGLELVDHGDEVWVIRMGDDPVLPDLPQLETAEAQHLEVPGALALLGGRLLTAREADAPDEVPGEVRRQGLGREVWVDRERFPDGLTVRAPQTGDRMQPLGMVGRRKLTDIFNTDKIAPAARPRWPVVMSGGSVVWLVGLRIGDGFRITKASRRALVLRLEDPE